MQKMRLRTSLSAHGGTREPERARRPPQATHSLATSTFHAFRPLHHRNRHMGPAPNPTRQVHGTRHRNIFFLPHTVYQGPDPPRPHRDPHPLPARESQCRWRVGPGTLAPRGWARSGLGTSPLAATTTTGLGSWMVASASARLIGPRTNAPPPTYPGRRVVDTDRIHGYPSP
jgi:hypothetical protein